MGFTDKKYEILISFYHKLAFLVKPKAKTFSF
jgi:hypothetical protein